MMTDIKALYAKIDYHFNDETIINNALLHASTFKIKQLYIESERYEFLGDRILGLVIAEAVFKNFPAENEGQLAKRHAHLVSSKTIAQVMNHIGLKNHIHHALENQIIPNSIIGNFGEALITAIYLDGGIESVRKVILTLWHPHIYDHSVEIHDPKSELQEYAQRQFNKIPSYKLLATSGTDHQPQFEVSVTLYDGQSAQGYGSSKKNAERDAALKLLLALRDQ